jgi:GT2 family glycosyltransferase/glycosyltransferase involved in cell wall biosynthesis/tetratricopeptide (TPR) repeat protein
MRLLVVGENLDTYLAKCHEAQRTGLRHMFDTRMFGEGYEGYDASLHTYEAIMRHTWPDAQPDVILADYVLSPKFEELRFYYEGFENIDIPKFIILSDFWNVTENYRDQFPKWLDRYGITAVLCHYPHVPKLYANTAYMNRFVHFPPCFDPKIMNDWQMEKSYDVGFMGEGVANYNAFYPERHAIHRKLLEKKGISYLWKHHPGWGRHPANHSHVGVRFSKLINSCRLFITTSGRYRCPFPKYIEILASKTVLLGEEPEGSEQLHLQDGINYVKINEHDIIDKIDYYLAHPELCEQIALAGFETAMRYHSCYSRALDFYSLTMTISNAPKPIMNMPSQRRAHSRSNATEATPIQTPCRSAPSGGAQHGEVPGQRTKIRPEIKRPHILLIADVPDWIFARHCQMLQRYLSDEFNFVVAFHGDVYNEEDFDLIYPLEWNLVKPEHIRTPAKYVTGIRSHLYWPSLDFFSFANFLSTRFQSVHVVSERLQRIFAPFLPAVGRVTHGVDASFFTPSTRADQSGRKVRVGWAGNRNSPEDKGFKDIIEPLSRLPGVELIFCGYSDKNLSMEEVRRFYDSLDIYVCASAREGSNNSLLEAAAMERAIITTDNGTVPEYLQNGESAIIVERHLPLFIQAVQALRDDPARRVALGKRARQAVLKGWDWKNKAEEYRGFFWEALKGQGQQRKEPLRLLLVAHGFPPHALAGTELYTYALAQELRARGHAVRVLYPKYDSEQPAGTITEDIYDGLPVTRISVHPKQDLVQQFKNEQIAEAFGRYLAGLEVDLVHFQHLIGLSALALESCSKQAIPTAMTLHDVWMLCEQNHFLQPDGSFCKGPETVDKCVQCVLARYPEAHFSEHLPQLFYALALRRQVLKKALTWIDTLIVPSRFIQETLKTHGFAHPNVVLAPLGLPSFRPSAPQPHQELLRFTYLGHITPTKGTDIAVRAFNLVDPENARLDLYGGIVNPAYWRQVMAEIKLDHKVEYHGIYAPDALPDILAQTDVAIIPSRAENYPTAIRECLHAGVPVIGPNVGGVPEIIEDGVNGLLFQPGDHEDLASKLRFFVQQPEEVNAFRQRIRPVRTITEDAAQLESLYRDILLRKSEAWQPETAARQPEAMQFTKSVASLLNRDAAAGGEGFMPESGEESRPSQLAVSDGQIECSIIIPVFNKLELTKQCLTHLAQVTQGVEYEVIVVDNASSDGTQELLASLSGDVQIIRNEENLGFAKACNQGARAAKGRYLVFLNNDTIPLDGWLQALLSEVQSHPDVAVVGSKLLYPDGTIQHAGVVFSRAFATPYHVYCRFPADAPVVNRRREFQVVTAACMLVRKEVFATVGGFDEGYRNGFEDVDLCLKIRDQGGRIIYQPNSVLYHLESQTPGRKDHDAENSRRLLERWGDRWLVDEDAIYVPDGYTIHMIQENGRISYRLTNVKDADDKARWERVAKVERLTQSGKIEAVHPLLAQADTWPNDTSVLRWAAQICDRAGVPTYAAAFWRRVLALEFAPDALASLARITLEKGDFDEAEQHLKLLLARVPGHGEGWLLQGILAMQRQDYVQARAAFEGALHHGGNPRKARKGLGMAAMSLGLTEIAWDNFATVLAEEIDDTEAIYCLLHAGTALERWQPLADYLSNYLKLNPGALSVRFALAGVEVRLGDWEAARETYEMIRLLDPTFDGLDDLAQILERRTQSVST